MAWDEQDFAMLGSVATALERIASMLEDELGDIAVALSRIAAALEEIKDIEANK